MKSRTTLCAVLSLCAFIFFRGEIFAKTPEIKTHVYEQYFFLPLNLADQFEGARPVHLVIESVPIYKNGSLSECAYRWSDRMGKDKPPIELEVYLSGFENFIFKLFGESPRQPLTYEVREKRIDRKSVV